MALVGKCGCRCAEAGPCWRLLAHHTLSLTSCLCLAPLPPPTPAVLQRVFMFDQTSWMRNVEYDIVVSATNAFCTSDNSTEAEILTP